MNRTAIFIIGGIVVLISILAIHNSAQPKPFRWQETYDRFDKHPYGAYVFGKQIDNFFPGNKVKSASSEIFDQYEYSGLYYDTTSYLYDMEDETLEQFNFFALDENFRINELDTRALLLHVFQGNDALIAANYTTEFLTDELGISLGFAYAIDSMDNEENPVFEQEKFTVSFQEDEWVDLKPLSSFTYIEEFPDSAKVIGTNKEGNIVGVQLEVGKGKLTLVTMPHVFSNYTILKTNSELSANLITTLPNVETYWASGNWSFRVNYEDTPGLLSFIHSQESLKWALYVLLVSVLVFFLFEIKRQQRPIPVIEPVQNISLKFSESISQLYLIRKDHREMVRKKMKFLMEKVRSDYQMNTAEINDHFYQRLSAKAEIKEKDIRQLFTLYFAYKDKSEVSEEEFLKFNRLVQLFKTKEK